VVVGYERRRNSEAVGALACLGAVACYGVGSIHRCYLARAASALALAAGQIAWAAVQLLPFAALDRHPIGLLTPQVVGAMLALGMLEPDRLRVNFQVIERAGAATASTVTFLTRSSRSSWVPCCWVSR